MPRIREVDSRLAERLANDNPSLAMATSNQNSQSGMVTNVSNSTPSQITAAQDRLTQLQTPARIQNEAPIHSDLALSDAQSLTGPQFRTLAFSEIAMQLASTDKKTSNMLGQAAENLKALADTEDKVRALFAVAKANQALHNQKEMWSTWSHAMDLGEELFQQDVEAHPDMRAYEAACSTT